MVGSRFWWRGTFLTHSGIVRFCNTLPSIAASRIRYLTQRQYRMSRNTEACHNRTWRLASTIRDATERRHATPLNHAAAQHDAVRNNTRLHATKRRHPTIPYTTVRSGMASLNRAQRQDVTGQDRTKRQHKTEHDAMYRPDVTPRNHTQRQD